MDPTPDVNVPACYNVPLAYCLYALGESGNAGRRNCFFQPSLHRIKHLGAYFASISFRVTVSAEYDHVCWNVAGVFGKRNDVVNDQDAYVVGTTKRAPAADFLEKPFLYRP